MGDDGIFVEAGNILRKILGIDPGLPEKPKPLRRLNEAEMMEATRRLQNKAAYDAMSKPGAMVLDSPAMPYLNEQQRKDFHARHGVLYRQGGPATSDQLPKDTIIVHPPKEWK